MTNKLEKMLEYLINGDRAKAEEMFKEHVVSSAAEIYQSLLESEEDIMEMERDGEIAIHDEGDHLADEISVHKDEIEAEEAFNEEDESLEDAVDDLEADLDGDVSSDDLELEDLHDDVEELEDRVDHVEDEHSELRRMFDELQGIEEVEHDEDLNDDGIVGDEVEIDIDGDLEELEESIKLTPVKADVKDVSSHAKSPVASGKKDKLILGGEPVVVDKGEKNHGDSTDDVKVGKLTAADNIVKNSKDLLKPVSKK